MLFRSLQDAKARRVNLRNADMDTANLDHIDLSDSDLQGAYMNGSNLERADLANAKLQAADLTGVNLRGANLTDAIFDEETMLPDGIRWTPDTDLRRYTDPAHMDFWGAAQDGISTPEG